MRRLHHFGVLTTACTKFTLAVRRNIHANGGSPQVSNVAEEFDRALAISAFHLAIGRTHPTQRLDAALLALRYPRTLARAQLQERILPNLLYPNLSDAESLLLRDHTDPHLAISIDGKPGHPPTTVIHRVDLREVRRILQVALRQTAIFGDTFRRVHVEGNNLLRRKPHRQRTLRAINPRIDLPVHLEFHLELLFHELPH